MREVDYLTKDLWWLAREKTHRKWAQPGIRNAIKNAFFTVKTISYRFMPTKTYEHPSAIAARSDVVYFPDFNKYRKRLLKPYIDAGCKAFCFRIGGPYQWVVGDPKWALDDTYYYFLEEADKYGVLDQTIGYIVHDCFEPWAVNGATGETVHTEMLDEWTSNGRMTRSFMYDHEVNKAWGAGRENVANGYTLRTSLQENTHNTYNKFHRTVSAYTADWFVNQSTEIWNEHNVYFTNINKPESEGGAGCQRPLWMAWYGQDMGKKLYTVMDQLGLDMFIPTPKQVGDLLWIGHQANAWQFDYRVKLAGAMPDGKDDTTGVDMNISLDPAKTFWYNFGLVEPGTVPDPDPDPDPDPTGDYVGIERYIADMAVINERLSDAETHTHQTLGPTL